MDANKLAAKILADREAEAATPRYEAPECFSCGRTFHCTGPDESGRFFSVRCRGWFDDGNPPYEKRVSWVTPCGGPGTVLSSRAGAAARTSIARVRPIAPRAATTRLPLPVQRRYADG